MVRASQEKAKRAEIEQHIADAKWASFTWSMEARPRIVSAADIARPCRPAQAQDTGPIERGAAARKQKIPHDGAIIYSEFGLFLTCLINRKSRKKCREFGPESIY